MYLTRSLIGKIPVSGEKLILVNCRACSAICCNAKNHARTAHDHPYSQIVAKHHPTFQSSLFKSNNLKCWNYRLEPRVYQVLEKSSPLYKLHIPKSMQISLTPKSVIPNFQVLDQLHYSQYRSIQTSTTWRKEESKVEKTVQALKESVKEAENAQILPEEKDASLVPAKKTLWQRVQAGFWHYVHGFRLLFIDMRICLKLIWQLLNGKSLSRREYNQLVRTTADLFRLLPMSVFILIPFAEFLLPVALHLFPNMLPSTFKEEKDEKEKIKKTLKAKIEMAKFLQKTIKESAVQAKKQEGQQTAESFGIFMDKIRKEGSKPSTKDIMKFAKLFEDEITLDNLSRQQLRACCIMLSITPIGSDALLRFLLQMKLRGLLADDKMIQKEGIETLTIGELQAANRSRGMRALGVSEDRLRYQLRQWLQLHLEEKIPTSLLLLSRALYLSETLSTEEKLGATITQLAETAADEAKVKVAEMSGEVVDNKTKLEIIKHEEAIIAAEKEALEREKKMVEEQEREMAEAKAAETAMDAHLSMDESSRTLETSSDEILRDTAEELQPSPSEAFKQDDVPEFTSKDLDDMETVLEEVAKVKRMDIERDALKGLKEEVTEYKEDLEDLKDLVVVCGAEQKELGESKAAKRLAKKVDSMISRLDSVVEGLQEEKSSIQEKISEEVRSLKEELGDTHGVQEQIDLYKSNIVTINEMLEALKRLKKIPDDSKLCRIFEVLDQDKDGHVEIDHALKVLELLSHENLKLSEHQVEEIINLLKHEALLEEQEKLQEKAEKEEMKKAG